MLRHASIYDRPSPADEGFRVLVMRRWPRGIRREAVDLWLKDAAPSQALLDAYHQQALDWPAFDQRYRAELLTQRPAALEHLRALERQHGSLVLLCHERIPPHQHCHRLILLQLLSAA